MTAVPFKEGEYVYLVPTLPTAPTAAYRMPLCEVRRVSGYRVTVIVGDAEIETDERNIRRTRPDLSPPPRAPRTPPTVYAGRLRRGHPVVTIRERIISMGHNSRPLAAIESDLIATTDPQQHAELRAELAAAGLPHLAAELDDIATGPVDPNPDQAAGTNRRNTEWTRRQLGDSRDV